MQGLLCIPFKGDTMLESDLIARAFHSDLKELYIYTFIAEQLDIQILPGPAESQVTLTEKEAARVMVSYSIGKESDFTKLFAGAEVRTYFAEDVNIHTKTIVNLAAHMLTDKGNIEMMYTTLLSNILHVPSNLRNRPN
jgi:hypothetical protein